MDWKKLTSRKFWLSVAAFLGSVSVSVAGIAAANEQVTTAGVVCGVLSAAIYAAAEAYVDGQSAKANGESTTTTKTVTATTSSAKVVAALTGTDAPASREAAE